MCKHWCLYGVPSICAQSCAPDSFARVLGEPWACQCPVLPSLLSARLLLLKLPFFVHPEFQSLALKSEGTGPA